MAESGTAQAKGAGPSRLRRMVVGTAVLAFVLASLFGAWEMPFIPWARSFGVWPTLTGRWVGTATMPDGRTSFAYLDLNGRMPGRGGATRAAIGGRARWCESRGVIHEYVVFGVPDNWRGTRFRIEMGSPGEHVRRLSALGGEWQGDVIRADGRILTYRQSVVVSEETAPAPAEIVRYAFRRGTEAEFQASCRRLADAVAPIS